VPVILASKRDKFDLVEFLRKNRRGAEDCKYVAAITKCVFMLHCNEWWKPDDSRSVKRTIALFDEFRDDILWAASSFPKNVVPMGSVGAFVYAHAVPSLVTRVEALAAEMHPYNPKSVVAFALGEAIKRWDGKYGGQNRIEQQRSTLDAIRLYCTGENQCEFVATLDPMNWIRLQRGDEPLLDNKRRYNR
jgi:hypothetical protein